MPHNSKEVILMLPTEQLICKAGRASQTLASNGMLLTLCKQLKLEAG